MVVPLPVPAVGQVTHLESLRRTPGVAAETRWLTGEGPEITAVWGCKVQRVGVQRGWLLQTGTTAARQGLAPLWWVQACQWEAGIPSGRKAGWQAAGGPREAAGQTGVQPGLLLWI